jgi:hypothetical protein
MLTGMVLIIDEFHVNLKNAGHMLTGMVLIPYEFYGNL